MGLMQLPRKIVKLFPDTFAVVPERLARVKKDKRAKDAQKARRRKRRARINRRGF